MGYWDEVEKDRFTDWVEDDVEQYENDDFNDFSLSGDEVKQNIYYINLEDRRKRRKQAKATKAKHKRYWLSKRISPRKLAKQILERKQREANEAALASIKERSTIPKTKERPAREPKEYIPRVWAEGQEIWSPRITRSEKNGNEY